NLARPGLPPRTAGPGPGEMGDQTARVVADDLPPDQRPGRRRQEEGSDDVGQEARDDQQGPADEYEDPVERLPGRGSSGGDRRGEVAEHRSALRADEPDPEHRRADEGDDRPPR